MEIYLDNGYFWLGLLKKAEKAEFGELLHIAEFESSEQAKEEFIDLYRIKNFGNDLSADRFYEIVEREGFHRFMLRDRGSAFVCDTIYIDIFRLDLDDKKVKIFKQDRSVYLLNNLHQNCIQFGRNGQGDYKKFSNRGNKLWHIRLADFFSLAGFHILPIRDVGVLDDFVERFNETFKKEEDRWGNRTEFRLTKSSKGGGWLGFTKEQMKDVALFDRIVSHCRDLLIERMNKRLAEHVENSGSNLRLKNDFGILCDADYMEAFERSLIEQTFEKEDLLNELPNAKVNKTFNVRLNGVPFYVEMFICNDRLDVGFQIYVSEFPYAIGGCTINRKMFAWQLVDPTFEI